MVNAFINTRVHPKKNAISQGANLKNAGLQWAEFVSHERGAMAKPVRSTAR